MNSETQFMEFQKERLDLVKKQKKMKSMFSIQAGRLYEELCLKSASSNTSI